MIGDLAALTAFLRADAHRYELARAWPEASLARYGALSGWGWGVPIEHGGLGLEPAERLRGYVALARGDMSTALFITQHEGAVDLVVTCDNEPLRRAWLPRFARGEALTTIGYSQLTTSRQGGAPAMRAVAVEGGFRLDGVMPWVTGAPYVTNVACGAALADGRQVLVLVPLDAPGVMTRPAEPLAALNSTHTCEVLCEGVLAPCTDVIAGPMHDVLSQRSALRLLLVSATGTGLALALLDELEALAARPGYGLAPASLTAARAECAALEASLHALAADPQLDQREIDRLRIAVDDWLVRLAGVLMVAAKGTGYRRASPAQRLAAEAMFLCVWSASGSVREGTIERLLARPPGPNDEARVESTSSS